MRLCSLHADFAVVFTPQAKYTKIRRKHRKKRTPLLTATSRLPPTEGTANLVVSCQEYARTSVRSYHRSTLVRRPVSLAIYARPVRQDKLSQQSAFSLSCGSVFAANEFLRYLVSNLVVIFTEDGVSGAPNGWEPVVVCHCMTLADSWTRWPPTAAYLKSKRNRAFSSRLRKWFATATDRYLV